MLVQVELGVCCRDKEVEHVATPSEARALAVCASGQDDGLRGFPPGLVIRVQPNPHLAAVERIARDYFDRQAEHRPDPERIDSAHRINPLRPIDQDAVATRRS